MTRARRGSGLHVAAGAGIALLAVLSAPFYWTPVGTIPTPLSVEGFDTVPQTLNAWASFRVIDIAVAACGVMGAALAVAILRGAADHDAIPVVQIFGAIAFVLLGYRLVVQLEPAELVSVRWGFGLALPLACTLALAPIVGTELRPDPVPRGDAVTLMGTAVLFAALFAPWYEVDAEAVGRTVDSRSISGYGGLLRINAFEALRVIDVALVLIAVAAAGLTGARLLLAVTGLRPWMVPALGLVAIALIGLRLAVGPDGFGRSWGGLLALAGAGAIAVGATVRWGGAAGAAPVSRRL